MARDSLALVGVHDEERWPPVRRFGHERPLQPRREPRAAAPAQAGRLDLVDDPVRPHPQEVLRAVPVAAPHRVLDAKVLLTVAATHARARVRRRSARRSRARRADAQVREDAVLVAQPAVCRRAREGRRVRARVRAGAWPVRPAVPDSQTRVSAGSSAVESARPKPGARTRRRMSSQRVQPPRESHALACSCWLESRKCLLIIDPENAEPSRPLADSSGSWRFAYRVGHSHFTRWLGRRSASPRS